MNLQKEGKSSRKCSKKEKIIYQVFKRDPSSQSELFQRFVQFRKRKKKTSPKCRKHTTNRTLFSKNNWNFIQKESEKQQQVKIINTVCLFVCFFFSFFCISFFFFLICFFFSYLFCIFFFWSYFFFQHNQVFMLSSQLLI